MAAGGWACPARGAGRALARGVEPRGRVSIGRRPTIDPSRKCRQTRQTLTATADGGDRKRTPEPWGQVRSQAASRLRLRRPCCARYWLPLAAAMGRSPRGVGPAWISTPLGLPQSFSPSPFL